MTRIVRGIDVQGDLLDLPPAMDLDEPLGHRPEAIPEPATLALLALGGLALLRRKR